MSIFKSGSFFLPSRPSQQNQCRVRNIRWRCYIWESFAALDIINLELLQALKTLVRVDFFPRLLRLRLLPPLQLYERERVIYQRRATLNSWSNITNLESRKPLIIGIINHELQVAGANCCRIPFPNFERELKFPPSEKKAKDDDVDKLRGRRESSVGARTCDLGFAHT